MNAGKGGGDENMTIPACAIQRQPFSLPQQPCDSTAVARRTQMVPGARFGGKVGIGRTIVHRPPYPEPSRATKRVSRKSIRLRQGTGSATGA